MHTPGILDQVAVATKPANRLASFLGGILGGFVPAASYVVAHMEVGDHPAKWALVAGGMIYSALTVFQWSRIAFKNAAKAFGFVVLLEGVAIFAGTLALSLSALSLLVAINALATAFNLVADRRDARSAKAKSSRQTASAAQKRTAGKRPAKARREPITGRGRPALHVLPSAATA